MVSIHGGWIAFIVIACLIVAFIGGFFTARYVIKRHLQKNPPITEKQIRAMYRSMGRKPSEAQIKRTMKEMEEANK